MLILFVIRKLSFSRLGTLTFIYFRFNGATTKPETPSNFPHKYVRSLGNYKNSPFVTGHSGSSTYGLKTEILNYSTSTWVQADDYPFSNTAEYVTVDIYCFNLHVTCSILFFKNCILCYGFYWWKRFHHRWPYGWFTKPLINNCRIQRRKLE